MNLDAAIHELILPYRCRAEQRSGIYRADDVRRVYFFWVLLVLDDTLDEMGVKINDRLHWLWRAVDQRGDVLDVLAQSRRDARAAKRGSTCTGLGSEHRQHKSLKNRAENPHQPTRGK